jgi:small subunit ribosomal protein S4e
MGKKGGRNKLKRLAAPKMWDLDRKRKRFIFKTSPGPYAIAKSYPLGVIIRDLTHLVKNARELKHVVNAGSILVDGRVRRSSAFGVGLFDIISVPSEGLNFRLVPTPKGLVLARVEKDEAERKLCGIRSKVKVNGGHIQYGLHDGRSVLSDTLDLSPGDSIVMGVPLQKVLDKVQLSKDSLGLILTGERAGQMGKILEVKKGTIAREKMVKIALPSGETEIPSRLVFPVGVDRPLVTVEAPAR